MAYSMGGMAVASTAFNTAMTAVTAVSQIRRIGNGAFDMARGFMGGGASRGVSGMGGGVLTP